MPGGSGVNTPDRGSSAMSRLVPRWVGMVLLTCVTLVVLGVTIWLGARVLGRLMVVTAAIVAALLLTALLQPLADLLEGRLRFPRWLASLTTVLTALGAIGGVGYLLVNRALAQSDDLGQALQEGGQQLRQILLDSPLPVSQHKLEAYQTNLFDGIQKALPAPSTGAAVAAQVLTGLALAVFLWFFLLKDGAAMWRWFLSWVPDRKAAAFETAGVTSWEVLTSYVRGTVVIALADALGIGAAMLGLGVPLVVSLTLLVFLGAFVPIVGSTVSGVVAVGVTFATVGPIQALLLVAAVIVVQQLEGNLLQPLVMGRALHLHPASIVLAVTVGAVLAGVLGALVAVPVLAMVYRVTEELTRFPRHDAGSPETAEPREATTDE